MTARLQRAPILAGALAVTLLVVLSDHAGAAPDRPSQSLDVHVYVPLAPNGVRNGPRPTLQRPTASATATDIPPTPTEEPPTPTEEPPTATPSPTPIPGPEWLAYVNRHRAAARLAPVAELAELTDGAVLHSRYMVKNDVIQHSEEPGNQWYTAAGDKAARNGNIYVSSFTGVPFTSPINMWMTGPFHMLGIVDPRLSETGYGDFSEAGGSWAFGATIDVLSKRERPVDGIEFPVLYPADGEQMWNLAYQGNESPDPLKSCPGYAAPTGPPLAIQLGAGNVTPAVSSTRFSSGGRDLVHCVFDQTSYTNSDRGSQDLGRGILRMRSAVVLMPKAPLEAGTEYEVEVTTGGEMIRWSFTASPTAKWIAHPGVVR